MTNASEKTIGFILKGYPRLSETFILNEILLLEQSGLKLHIFALRNPGEAKVHDKVRQVRAGVTYIPDYFWPYFWAFIKTNLLLWWSRPALYWQARTAINLVVDSASRYAPPAAQTTGLR